MTSPAISAQHTLVKIASGTGVAKTITAVAVGNPTILTAAAHGMANGDNVTFSSGFTGADAALLNGKTAVIKYVSTNTFAVDIDTTGKTITAGTATATGATYTNIGGVTTINDVESGSANEIDTTDLDSVAKEYLLGLADNGSFSLAGNHAWTDAGQLVAQQRRNDGAVVNMKIVLPSGPTPTASFAALVKKFAKSMGVDNAVKFSMDIRVTGAITWA